MNATELSSNDAVLESARPFCLIADSDLYASYMKRKLASFDLFSLALVKNEELILDDIAYIYASPSYAYSSMFLDSVSQRILFSEYLDDVDVLCYFFLRKLPLHFNYYHGNGIDTTYTFYLFRAIIFTLLLNKIYTDSKKYHTYS